jgi:hypothetical protein
MENNKFSDLFYLAPESKHELFVAKIQKPMEPHLHVSSNFMNAITANAMESSKLGDVVLEDPILETLTFNENDDIISSGLDNRYRDSYDTCYNYPYESCHSYDGIAKNHPLSMQLDYHVQILDNDLAPITINENSFSYAKNNDTFMHKNHDKNVLSDGYIVDFINDATESYYERGKHGYMHPNNIKFPLFMLRILKLRLCCFSVLVTLCFQHLFLCKTPIHRKWVRLKCVSYLLLDALFFFNSNFICEHLLKSLCLAERC